VTFICMVRLERRCGQLKFCRAARKLLPSFEKVENGRILHAVAPVIRRHCDVTRGEIFGHHRSESQLLKLRRVLELHEAMLGRAARAIGCWGIVACRLGLVKDLRVMIAKMLWEEAWRWSV
jgi:hypothetical protein